MKRKIIATTIFLTFFSFAFPLHAQGKGKYKGKKVTTVVETITFENWKENIKNYRENSIVSHKVMDGGYLEGNIPDKKIENPKFTNPIISEYSLDTNPTNGNNRYLHAVIKAPSHSMAFATELFKLNEIFSFNFEYSDLNGKFCITRKEEKFVLRLLDNSNNYNKVMKSDDIHISYEFYKGIDNNKEKLFFDNENKILLDYNDKITVEFDYFPVAIIKTIDYENKECENNKGYKINYKYDVSFKYFNNINLNYKYNENYYLQRMTYFNKDLYPIIHEFSYNENFEYNDDLKDAKNIEIIYIKRKSDFNPKKVKVSVTLDDKELLCEDILTDDFVAPGLLINENITQNVANNVSKILATHNGLILPNEDDRISRQRIAGYNCLYELCEIIIDGKEYNDFKEKKLQTDTLEFLKKYFITCYNSTYVDYIIYTSKQLINLPLYELFKDNLKSVQLKYNKINSIQTKLLIHVPIQSKDKKDPNVYIGSLVPLDESHTKHINNVHTKLDKRKNGGGYRFNIRLFNKIYISEQYLVNNTNELNGTKQIKNPKDNTYYEFELTDVSILVDNNEEFYLNFSNNISNNKNKLLSNDGMKSETIKVTKNTKNNDILLSINEDNIKLTSMDFNFNSVENKNLVDNRNLTILPKYSLKTDNKGKKQVFLVQNTGIKHYKYYDQNNFYVIMNKTDFDGNNLVKIKEFIKTINPKDLSITIQDLISEEENKLKLGYDINQFKRDILFNGKTSEINAKLIDNVYIDTNLNHIIINYKSPYDFSKNITYNILYEDYNGKLQDLNYIECVNIENTIVNGNGLANIYLEILNDKLISNALILDNVKIKKNKNEIKINGTEDKNKNTIKYNLLSSLNKDAANLITFDITVIVKGFEYTFFHKGVCKTIYWAMTKYSYNDRQNQLSNTKSESKMAQEHCEKHLNEEMIEAMNLIYNSTDSNFDLVKVQLQNKYKDGIKELEKLQDDDYTFFSQLITNLLIKYNNNKGFIEEEKINDREYKKYKITIVFKINNNSYSFFTKYLIPKNDNNKILLLTCGVDKKQNNEK